MNRLFGSRNAAPKPGLAEAIRSTEERADGVEVKVRKLDAELGRYRDQMKKMRDGPGKVSGSLFSFLNPAHSAFAPQSHTELSCSFVSLQTAIQQRALRVLKQKRLYEGQLAQLQQQAYNMEQATMTTENLRNTMATVDAMQTANKEMKKTYGKIDLDKIERVQDDMEDLIESANEVQETLGRTYGVPDDIDEADLQAELDALGDDLLADDAEADAMPSYLQSEGSTTGLPDFIDEAPTSNPAQHESHEALRAA